MIFYFKTTLGLNTIKTMLQEYCSFLIEQSKLKTIKENLYVHSFTMQWHNNSRGAIYLVKHFLMLCLPTLKI